MANPDQWERVTRRYHPENAAPCNMFGAYTFREWCLNQIRWMQERDISARIAYATNGETCFIETKQRKLSV